MRSADSHSALGGTLAPGITDFTDLFTEDAVIDVPFDSDGTVEPIVDRTGHSTDDTALDGILRFDEVTFREVHTTHKPEVVMCEYDAILTRYDLGDQFRRRYISVLTLNEGRIASLREYGGPFQPVDSAA